MAVTASQKQPKEFETGLTERDAAAYFGCSLELVRTWRKRGVGPRYRKVGSLVRYELRDLREHWDSLPRGGQQAQSEARA